MPLALENPWSLLSLLIAAAGPVPLHTMMGSWFNDSSRHAPAIHGIWEQRWKRMRSRLQSVIQNEEYRLAQHQAAPPDVTRFEQEKRNRDIDSIVEQFMSEEFDEGELERQWESWGSWEERGVSIVRYGSAACLLFLAIAILGILTLTVAPEVWIMASVVIVVLLWAAAVVCRVKCDRVGRNVKVIIMRVSKGAAIGMESR